MVLPWWRRPSRERIRLGASKIDEDRKNDGLFFSLRVVVPAGMPGRILACLVSLTLKSGCFVIARIVRLRIRGEAYYSPGPHEVTECQSTRTIYLSFYYTNPFWLA
jgi:hypothetical protein